MNLDYYWREHILYNVIRFEPKLELQIIPKTVENENNCQLMVHSIDDATSDILKAMTNGLSARITMSVEAQLVGVLMTIPEIHKEICKLEEYKLEEFISDKNAQEDYIMNVNCAIHNYLNIQLNKKDYNFDLNYIAINFYNALQLLFKSLYINNDLNFNTYSNICFTKDILDYIRNKKLIYFPLRIRSLENCDTSQYTLS